MSTEMEAKQRTDRQWVEAILVSAQKRKWYGTLTIEVKNGRVQLIDVHQTLKPPSSLGSSLPEELARFSS